MKKILLSIAFITLPHLSLTMTERDLVKMRTDDKTLFILGVGGITAISSSIIGLKIYNHLKTSNPELTEKIKKYGPFATKLFGSCLAAASAGYFGVNEIVNIYRNNPNFYDQKDGKYHYYSDEKYHAIAFKLGHEGRLESLVSTKPYQQNSPWYETNPSEWLNKFYLPNVLFVLPSATTAFAILSYKLGKSALEDYKKLS